MQKTSINIVGDFSLTNEYSSKNIDNSIKNIFDKNSYNIVNLENPIAELSKKNRLEKSGPHLLGNIKSSLSILKYLNISLCTTANNHIKDYGETGITDTINNLSNNNIEYIGIGKNKKEASNAKSIKIDSKTISLLNYAENEWSSATENSFGSNPYDIVDICSSVKYEKNNSNFVIVIIHGGNEFYNLPSPKIQKDYRFIIDQGADLVISHHTHCTSGYEIYNGKEIYYGLGNFLFTIPNENPDWYNGILLNISISQNKLSVKRKYTIFEKNNFALRLSNKIESELLEKKFITFSKIISDKNKLMKNWNMFVNKRSKAFFKILSPMNHFLGYYPMLILYKINLLFIKRNSILHQLNMIRCESHRYLVLDILNMWLNKTKKNL